MKAQGLRLAIAAFGVAGIMAMSGCLPIAAGATVGAAASGGANKSVEKGAAVGGLAGAALAL